MLTVGQRRIGVRVRDLGKWAARRTRQCKCRKKLRVVHRQLDKWSVLNAEFMKWGKPAARVSWVAICVDVCYIDSRTCSVKKSVACGHNLRGAGVLGSPFDKGEAGRHVVVMEDDVGEAGVGDEV